MRGRESNRLPSPCTGRPDSRAGTVGVDSLDLEDCLATLNVLHLLTQSLDADESILHLAKSHERRAAKGESSLVLLPSGAVVLGYSRP